MSYWKNSIVAGVVLTLFGSCKTAQDGGAPVKSHHTSYRNFDVTVWVDPFECSRLMKSGADSAFRCFRVGRIDSTAITGSNDGDRKAIERYWQLDMWKDWTLVSGSDTVRPVFFEIETSLNDVQRTAVLVFETNQIGNYDSLLFSDGIGGGRFPLLVKRY